MKILNNGKRGVVGLLVAAFLLAPVFAQAKEKNWEQFRERRAKTIKEMKLSPDKAKEMQQVDEKYAKDRKDIFDNLRKNQDELKKAMAASNPDEGKVKDLVSNITSLQDKIMDSFKNQRNDELGLMTPIQQGKYLQSLGTWGHEMAGKYKGKKKAGQ